MTDVELDLGRFFGLDSRTGCGPCTPLGLGYLRGHWLPTVLQFREGSQTLPILSSTVLHPFWLAVDLSHQLFFGNVAPRAASLFH